MGTNVSKSLSFSNITYTDAIQCLGEVSNKLEVNNLAINFVSMFEFQKHMLNDLKNLIFLNLSNCDIHIFENNVFENLIHLKFIDLSYNVITSITNSLFRSNIKLETILLKSNLLDSINNIAFSQLINLQNIDLSYNLFSVLVENFLSCPNLKVLSLHHNHINSVTPTAFYQLPNLIHLQLNNNQIEHLDEQVFSKLTNLRNLNLNHNLIQEVSAGCFVKLQKLAYLYFRHNYLTAIDNSTFAHNTELIEIDLFDNDISDIVIETFLNCQKVKILKLTVTELFETYLIEHLAHLNIFEIFYKTADIFYTSNLFWNSFDKRISLTEVKIIFKKIKHVVLCNFSDLVNLRYFHIECLEPSTDPRRIRIKRHFDHMPNLQQVTLRRLNYFTVVECRIKRSNLTLLNLAGVKNQLFMTEFKNFTQLQYLDLSFSELSYIHEYSFKSLVNLEHLELAYSKIRSIYRSSFSSNSKLEILNCSNCLIDYIDDYSFANLSSLTLLDLSNNNQYQISENTFYGLNEETCIILL